LGVDPRDTVLIRRNRLDVVARRPWRGAWSQLRAGVDDALAPLFLHRRRLRAEREVERIFEMSPDLLAVAGFDGYLRRFNPAFEMFGYSREELLLRPWVEFAHPDDRERLRQAVATLERGDVLELESRVVCRDGSVRWVQWSTRVVPEEGLLYAAGRDVTESRRTAEEQAALRRVATLAAREAAPDEVFEAVGRAVGEVLGVDATHLGRYDHDGTVVSVAQWGAFEGAPIGARFPLEGENVSARVLRTGRPARMDYSEASGAIAAAVRKLGIRSSIGVPVSVAGRPWGVMIASTRSAEPLPAETESQLEHFTELVATAISNASAHDKLLALADEQAALRRIATLVARETPQAEVFAAIAEEIGRLLGVDSIEMVRYEQERFAVVMAGWGTIAVPLPSGTRVPLEGRNVTSLIFRTGRAARLDDHRGSSGEIADRVTAAGVRSAVGTPIFVEGRLWGAMIAASIHELVLPPGTESRIAQFTELMATAIANAEARAEVARLADEQAALRRVATLVAQGAAPSAVFDAVTAEVSAVLDASVVTLARYDGDGLIVLSHSAGDTHLTVGQRLPLEPANLTAIVRRTGRIARRDHPAEGTGPIAAMLRDTGVRSTVAAPIVVDGRTWGVLAASWTESARPPEETEERMARFAELLDTAIANADSRDQLTASRARVLAAADDARRRVVRDLHDGAQQRLVHTIVTLKLARQALREHAANANALVEEGLGYAEGAIADLRELAHGILPAGLIRGGLGSAVDTFVSRIELPVEVDISTGRLPRDVEASAYFIVAEALTNVVKHARATRAAVTAAVGDGSLRVEVRDDGVGGANLEGYGLMGVADRVDALGGELTIESESSGGTVVVATLPLSIHAPLPSPSLR
jgi:PAS domain S-box-containing protein